MIYALIGQTCSGKTTALKQLVELGYKTVTSYTTRPKRTGEIDGVDYYFISKQQYDHLDEFNLLAAKNNFKSASGDDWFYAVNVQDLQTKEDLVLILDPVGYRDLSKKLGKEKFVGIYLNTKTEVRLLRGLNRKDSTNELIRRMMADEIDFQDFENEVEYVVVGLEKQQILDKILKVIKEGELKIELAYGGNN